RTRRPRGELPVVALPAHAHRDAHHRAPARHRRIERRRFPAEGPRFDLLPRTLRRPDRTVMTVCSVDQCWWNGWRGPTVLTVDAAGIRITPDARPQGHLAGTVLPGLRDSHGHLGLIDAGELLLGGVAAVDDLGGNLGAVAAASADPCMPQVRFTGPFITAVGGYPSDRPWLPEGGCVEAGSIDAAVAAVDAHVDAGASFVKVALNTVAGNVLDDDTLAAIVRRGHERGVSVVAHAE